MKLPLTLGRKLAWKKVTSIVSYVHASANLFRNHNNIHGLRSVAALRN
jgi:hypothetical protein